MLNYDHMFTHAESYLMTSRCGVIVIKI